MSRRRGEQGFTIIELMIALAVLSTLLVGSTLILMQLGQLYTKGVNESNTQNVTRNIVNDIASQLQLSGNVPQWVAPATPATATAPSSPGVICIGNQRYTYVLNHELGDGAVDDVLWRETIGTDSGTCVPNTAFAHSANPQDKDSVAGSGQELVSSHMRLTELSLTPGPANSHTYTLGITVAYGDDDLIKYDPAAHTTRCVGTSGTEYCAVASLQVLVGQRIVNN